MNFQKKQITEMQVLLTRVDEMDDVFKYTK